MNTRDIPKGPQATTSYRPHFLDDWLRVQGRSKRWLADQLGVAENTVGRWARYERMPGVKQMPRIAAVLGIDTDELRKRPPPPGATDLGKIIDQATPETLEQLAIYARFLVGQQKK